MRLLSRPQIQMFDPPSKKAWPPNSPRLTVSAKIVIM